MKTSCFLKQKVVLHTIVCHSVRHDNMFGMDTCPCCWLISLGFLVLLRWPTKPNDEKNEQKDIELRVNSVFFFSLKSHRVLGEW